MEDQSKTQQTERQWDDEVLRLIVAGTASLTGDDFFESLVQHLAKALQVRFAFIAEFADVSTRVRTISFWKGKDFLENFEYDLSGTPCEKVLRGEICHYPEEVQTLFPSDEDLVRLGAESYLAIPLVDPSGHVSGHLAALDDKPMPAEPRDFSIFKIFAQRATAELQRIQNIYSKISKKNK